MATLRQWFNEAKVDWSTFTLIVHTFEGHSPGWGTPLQAVLFDFTQPGALDLSPHPLLDVKFDSGYGAPEAPRFIGHDKERIYFPVQYDGATWLEFIYKDLAKYMDVNVETPYPGG